MNKIKNINFQNEEEIKEEIIRDDVTATENETEELKEEEIKNEYLEHKEKIKKDLEIFFKTFDVSESSNDFEVNLLNRDNISVKSESTTKTQKFDDFSKISKNMDN